MPSAKQIAWRKKFAKLYGKKKKGSKKSSVKKRPLGMFLLNPRAYHGHPDTPRLDFIASMKKWAKRGDEASIRGLKALKRKGKKKFFEDLYR